MSWSSGTLIVMRLGVDSVHRPQTSEIYEMVSEIVALFAHDNFLATRLQIRFESCFLPFVILGSYDLR